MSDNHPSETPERRTRKIPIHERSVRVGDVIVVNGHNIKRNQFKDRFAEGGYQVHETPHFLLFTREEAPKIVLVHWFTSEELHTNIPRHLAHELKPFNIIPSNQVLAELMTGIVGGTLYPDDVRRAWNYFGANTLQRLLTLVSSAVTTDLPDYGSLGESAILYQRVFELAVGERFLDAACNGGFFALLLAERIPFVSEVVGVDIDADVFRVAQELVEERHLSNVHFMQADLLSDDLRRLGVFDTVTALHVLEHFTEEEMYRVLNNLLNVTAHRLIFAVPFEVGEPSAAYDHKQLFTRTKLESVGEWCIKQLQGAARMWYEDLPRSAGLLLVERCSS
ncbi:MAG TPA: class I SAM-dependent methyltransferase [Ktedonobacteraceae bacterium]|nr:class I SAM-dependent methyltransferase [Ktedonobacteraceae bacterium]